MFKVIPIKETNKALKYLRNLYYSFLYENYTQIPCLGDNKKVFDFFFSNKFLINVLGDKDHAFTAWSAVTCPVCNKIFVFRVEVVKKPHSGNEISWFIRQSPPMTNEEFIKQFNQEK